MQKPKSLAMMNTQPLNNNYIDFKTTQNINQLFQDRHSAISLQIGGGTYGQYQNKSNSRFSQKANTRSGSSKIFGVAKNTDNYNIRYTKYHQIYANQTNGTTNAPSSGPATGPIRAVQKKNEKLTNNRISTMDELARGRKDGNRPSSNKRKTLSHQVKRATSPKSSTYYSKNNEVERPKFIKPSYQKIVSATNGFEIYKAEKVYSETRPIKTKQSKRVGSKKKNRIR
jgi:hypothetical protein